MRAVSSRFLSTLRGSHTAAFRARLVTSLQTGTTPVTAGELQIVDGDVRVSATADVYANLDLTIAADWPTPGSMDLSPYGNEIYVERGLSYGQGQREFVGLGYFRIDTMEQQETPSGAIHLVLPDRMQGLIDARFVAPRQFPGSWLRRQLVEALVWEVYPNAAIIEWDDVAVRDAPVGRTVITELDRYATLKNFVRSLGKVCYFDHRGILVIKTPPSVLGGASWEVNAGRDGVLVQMSRALTREGVYNAVVVTGEAADTTPPVTAVAYNLDPSSPTYYQGRFGPVPRFYSSPFITDKGQAQTAATSFLRQQLGVPYQVELSSVVNPALEAWDVIDVVYPERDRSPALRTERHVVDQVSIPLTATGVQSITTRQQANEIIGELS